MSDSNNPAAALLADDDPLSTTQPLILEADAQPESHYPSLPNLPNLAPSTPVDPMAFLTNNPMAPQDADLVSAAQPPLAAAAAADHYSHPSPQVVAFDNVGGDGGVPMPPLPQPSLVANPIDDNNNNNNNSNNSAMNTLTAAAASIKPTTPTLASTSISIAFDNTAPNNPILTSSPIPAMSNLALPPQAHAHAAAATATSIMSTPLHGSGGAHHPTPQSLSSHPAVVAAHSHGGGATAGVAHAHFGDNSSVHHAPSSDAPCWGGPEQHHHNLEYLLQVLGKSTQSIETMDDRSSHNNTSSKCKQQINEDNYSAFIQRIHEKLILYQDENYIAIHKPPDLRMDGPHLATVHKLLLFLFPPLSLRKLISNEDTDACDLKNKNDGAAIEKARDGPGNSGVSEKCNNHNSEGNAHTTDENKTTSNYYNHRRLLQCIYPLSTHSSLKDDPFRIVHQLDYATSGVLLLARNKHAAGVACRSFMERKTNKKYLAVITLPINVTLDGTTDPLPPLGPEFFQKLPILPSSALSQWENGSLEQKYRKKRRREAETREGKKGTFNGFMPVHAVFAKWRAVLLREKKEAEGHSKKASVNDAGVQQRDISMQEQYSEEISAKRKHANWKQQPKTDTLPPLPKPKTELTTEEIDEMLLIGPSWKAIKTHCASNNKRSKCWITMLEAMAKEYNQSLEEYYSKKNEIEEAEEAMEQEKNRNENATGCSDDFNMGTLPPLFRLQEEEGGVGKNANEKVADNTSTFYICASIGEPDDGRFTVVVDPVAAFSSSGYKDNVGTTTSLDMKPSLTKCTVLWKGYLDARSDNYALVDDSTSRIPVAKVLLEPRTGRRHQLRIHMAQICGYPILGDVAYGGNIVEMNTSNDNGDNLCGYLRGLSCDRMCLHAKQLAIPLIGGENKTFSAPDPFPIVEQCVSIS